MASRLDNHRIGLLLLAVGATLWWFAPRSSQGVTIAVFGFAGMAGWAALRRLRR